MGYNLLVGKSTFAAIDIGTNTFRLLIAEVYPDAEQKRYLFKHIYADRIITRLGEGITESGLINERAMERGLSALQKFSTAISNLKVSKTSAVATSALRDAKNSGHFIQKVKELTGLEIEVISGDREAEMTAAGILSDMSVPESALMVDIGGGSTELIFYDAGNPLLVKSVNLGVVHLAVKYMQKDPPLTQDLEQMEEDIIRQIRILTDYFKPSLTKDTVFIGTAGTITALAAMAQDLTKFDHAKIHKYILNFDNVRKIYETISVISSGKRAQLIPFELARLDIIVPGTLILFKLMESLGFKEMSVSNHGLLEGILLDLCDKEHG